MKRYTIAFMSMSTGMPLEYGHTDSPADALKSGRNADKEGLRNVKIIDMTTREALDIKAFAAKHRL